MRSLHAVLRELHLLCGLVLSLVVFFYFVSGAAVLFIKYLPGEAPTVATEQLAMPAGAGTADDATLRALMGTAAGAEGRIQPLERLQDGGLRLRFQQPAAAVVADLSADRSTLTVTRTRHGVLRVLRGLHTLTGRGGGPGYFLWSLLVDLVALAVMGFAASGIWLWYRRMRDHRLGWLILGGTWGYTIGVIAWLMLA